MPAHTAYGDSLLSAFRPRVREFAVPPSTIETATARRHAGDWAGACAAAGIDVDLDLRSTARPHGRELAARVRAGLRHPAPGLLRRHRPRIAPDGLLRPGLTIALARYDAAEHDGADRLNSSSAHRREYSPRGTGRRRPAPIGPAPLGPLSLTGRSGPAVGPAKVAPLRTEP